MSIDSGRDGISIVVAVFNEEESLGTLCPKLFKILNQFSGDSEIIFIDDGSTDTSYDILESFARSDHRIRLIRFKKNAGQCKALEQGIHEAANNTIITLDADLQNDPEDIPRLVAELKKGYDLVCGWRSERKDPWHKKLKSKIGNIGQRRLSGLDIHDICCNFRAYRKSVVEGIKLGERYSVCLIPLIISERTKKISEVKIKHYPRLSGRSKYGFFPMTFGVVKSYVNFLFSRKRTIAGRPAGSQNLIEKL